MAVILYFIDGDAGVTFASSSGDEKAVVNRLYRKLKTNDGPLSTAPRDAEDLADKIADAFGGECSLCIERSPE